MAPQSSTAGPSALSAPGDRIFWPDVERTSADEEASFAQVSTSATAACQLASRELEGTDGWQGESTSRSWAQGSFFRSVIFFFTGFNA